MAFIPPSTLPNPKKAPAANAARYRTTNIAPMSPSYERTISCSAPRREEGGGRGGWAEGRGEAGKMRARAGQRKGGEG